MMTKLLMIVGTAADIGFYIVFFKAIQAQDLWALFGFLWWYFVAKSVVQLFTLLPLLWRDFD